MIESSLPIVESVINVSIGRDQLLLDKIRDLLHRPGYCYLLHMDIGYDANRTVITLVGVLKDLFVAIDDLVVFLSDNCDIQLHSGAHPYMGMLDVIPFIPLRNISMEELSDMVKDFALELGNKNQLPIYYYGRMSNDAARKTLAQLRKGGDEKLQRGIKTFFSPDAGPNELHPSMGVSCMTVRDFMAAYNINILARDLDHAKQLSKRLIKERQDQAEIGTLDTRNVRFMAWYMPTYNCYQLSTNIYDVRAVDLYSLYQYIELKAKDLDLLVQGAELIGMVPLRAICSEEVFLQDALEYIDLKSVKPFDEKKNILEYQLVNLKWAQEG